MKTNGNRRRRTAPIAQRDVATYDMAMSGVRVAP